MPAIQEETVMKRLAPLIAEAGKHPLTIAGHTDSVGNPSYNQGLSEKRARTVKDWLVSHSYAPATTSIKGYGETMPVAPNIKPDGSDNPEGRRLNRRVEIVIDTCH